MLWHHRMANADEKSITKMIKVKNFGISRSDLLTVFQRETCMRTKEANSPIVWTLVVISYIITLHAERFGRFQIRTNTGSTCFPTMSISVDSYTMAQLLKVITEAPPHSKDYIASLYRHRSKNIRGVHTHNSNQFIYMWKMLPKIAMKPTAFSA